MKKLLFLLALLPFAALAQSKIAEVEHGTDSVILNFPLYDATDPSACPSTDLTDETVGLKITIYDDVTDGEVDQFECTGAAGCGTTDTIETIATLGTYSTPSANSARFKVLEAGSCWYQLQLPNAIFDTANANVINIEVTDGQTNVIDGNFWVDLTPVSQTTLIASLLATDCDSPAAGSLEEQWCTDVDAILTDTGTTLDTRQQTIATNTNYDIIASDSADSGSATTLVDADVLAGAFSDDIFNNGAKLYVTFATGVEARCVRNYVDLTGTVTVYPAFSTAITTESFKLVADVDCRTFP